MHTYPTQAVILAGGQGSRLRPYTDDRPKPMVEIPGTGTPIIGHQLSWLAAEGVTDAVVSCGHLAEVLQEWLEEAVLPLRVTTVVETEPLGRGGGLRYAAERLPDADQPWYATNGDIWTRFSLREMAAFHAERDATATLALARPRIPWGAVETDAFGHITDFIESPPSPYLI
ncbi:NTP transferase domain-containing protein, partial [Streptomyces sp. SID4931]